MLTLSLAGALSLTVPPNLDPLCHPQGMSASVQSC